MPNQRHGACLAALAGLFGLSTFVASVGAMPSTSASVHQDPQTVTILESTRLSGEQVVDSFRVAPGVTVLVDDDDLTIIARGDIVIEGAIRARSARGPGSSAPSITLRADGQIIIDGRIIAGDGADGASDVIDGGHGTSITLRAPLIVLSRPLQGGVGGDGTHSGNGGHGGSVRTFGATIPGTLFPVYLRGGSGGRGGDGIGADPDGLALPGGTGGRGGSAVVGAYDDEAVNFLQGGDDVQPSPAAPISLAILEAAGVSGPLGVHGVAALGGDGGRGGCGAPAATGRSGSGGNGGAGGHAKAGSGLPWIVASREEGRRIGAGDPGGFAIGGAGGRAGHSGAAGETGSAGPGGTGGAGGYAVGGNGGNVYKTNDRQPGDGIPGIAGPAIPGNGGRGGNGSPGGSGGQGGAAIGGAQGITTIGRALLNTGVVWRTASRPLPSFCSVQITAEPALHAAHHDR